MYFMKHVFFIMFCITTIDKLNVILSYWGAKNICALDDLHMPLLLLFLHGQCR